jgi:hypothetical protein
MSRAGYLSPRYRRISGRYTTFVELRLRRGQEMTESAFAEWEHQVAFPAD